MLDRIRKTLTKTSARAANKPLLSIIIPAYNAMPYIERMLHSIYNGKTDEDAFEVIVVDDGSTDDLSDCCSTFASLHKNIVYYRQDNSGSPAGPRNKGVILSHGQYVFFADADDYFFPNAVEGILHFIAKNPKVDVALFKIDATEWNMDYGGVFNKSSNNCTVFNSKIMNTLGPYKLFRRSLIVDNGISFPEHVAYEDLPFVMECYMRGKSISIVADRAYYKYVKRQDGGDLSATNDSSSMFGQLSKKVDGILYYIEKCKSLSSPDACPFIFERAARYTARLVPTLCKKNMDNELERLRLAMHDICVDSVKVTLAFSALTVIDALLADNRPVLDAIVHSWPDGPRLGFTRDEVSGEVWYTCHPDESDALLQCRFPAPGEWGYCRLLDPKIVRNLITLAKLSDDTLVFSGEVDMLRNVKTMDDFELDAHLVVELNGVKRAVGPSVTLTNVEKLRCYETVWHVSFCWHIEVGLQDILSCCTNKKESAAFYLGIELGTQNVESRFGHKRIAGVLNDLFSNAAVFNGLVIAPTCTKYENISINIIPVEQIANMPVALAFSGEGGVGRLLVYGNQGFDNYPETVIRAILGDTVTVLDKGPRRGAREYSGLVDLSTMHPGCYGICASLTIGENTIQLRELRLADGTVENSLHMNMRRYRLAVVEGKPIIDVEDENANK